MTTPYSVAVVVDPQFGERLRSLAQRLHTWVVDTPGNRVTVESMRASPPSNTEYSIESGVTTFAACGGTAEERCLGVIGEIDLHHCNLSHNPGYTVLEAYGVALSPNIRTTFAEYGFAEFVPTPDGFVARKHEP